MSLPSLAVKFTIIDLLSRGVDQVKNRLKSLTSANKDVQRSFNRMKTSFKWGAISGVATRELYKGLKPAVSWAGDLQEELIAVKAELMTAGKSAGVIAQELKKAKATAFGVQAWTPFDMAQIVALEKELVKAGASMKEIAGESGAAAATAALAVYERLDPTETGKALIGIGTPFKVAADRYMELADMISRAAAASVTGAAEIAETAKYAAGPMAILGRSQKEMLALSAVMAQVGIDASMAGTTMRTFYTQAAKHRAFRDARGNLIPLADIIKKLRDISKGRGSAQVKNIMERLFSLRGMNVALALLNEGKGSYEDILKAMDEAAPLQDKLAEAMKGYKRQLTGLKGTARSTIANIYLAALPPLTYLIKKMNEFWKTLGKASMESENLGKAVTGLSGGALGVGSAATLALGGAGLWYGRKVLKGVGGWKALFGKAASTAGGIAAGKAVEAATGVQPVFVTNWPEGFGAGASSAAAAAAGAGWLGRFKGLASKAGPWGLVATAGFATGWGAGRLISGIPTGGGKDVQHRVEDLFARIFLSEERYRDYQTQNNIELNVNIDRDGRVATETSDMGTKVNVNPGRF